MFDDALAIGPGYKVPTYHELRLLLLKDAKKEVQLWVDNIRSIWAHCGCTIMGDGWTDNRNRTLINFLIYCPRGTIFWKSVDASDVVKDAQALFNLFQEVIEWVGPSNVVHMVTDNGANYVAAGRKVQDHYKSISWSPCAAHCLNLVMKDIAKLDHVAEIVNKASQVTRFVYNHVYWLSWLRKRKDWTEILRPGETRFGTTFTALYNVYHHMHDLKALVTCKEFVDSRLARERKTKEVIAIVLDNKFWNDCLIIVKIMEPLMRLLKIVDGDTKPSIGYVYEGMYRARKGIKNLFKNKKRLYKPYTTIIKSRWDRQLRKDIHAATYWFNPAFQYEQASFCQKPEVMNGVLEVITTKGIGSKSKLLHETRLFRDRLESFGQELALETSKNTQPGCERNWSVFERIHTKKRNRLEHQRLNDLVYVHYNLKLKDRWFMKVESYDPIDYESIDKINFWIVDDEEEPFLNYEDIDNMLYEQLDPPRMERQRRRGREDITDCLEDLEDQEDLEIDDDIDFSAFDQFNLGDNLHDVSVGLGEGSSNAGGAFLGDDAW
ncbi:UNVERIFIED_CONTAM: hypothetical protein Sradi_5228400 [Sesamum radiatum]|uniref:DUF659 domain-containing protein n=1 Tax=Sesamum radiatum TaxID=300843 RepID=A0AAW2LKG6_SESRA